MMFEFQSKPGRAVSLLLLGVFLIYAALASPPEADGATAFGDIDVTAESTPGGRSSHGYVEYRFSMTNHSPRRGHTVTLVMDSSGGGGLRQTSRSVRMGPSSTVSVSLFQPPLSMYGSGVTVLLDGERQREKVYLSRAQHLVDSYPQLCPLVSQDVSGDVYRSISGAYSSQRRHYSFAIEATKAELPVTGWSRNWLGYSRYDGIVVSSEDMMRMPGDVRTALIHYVECGGALLVLGALDVPETWQARKEQTAGGLDVYYLGFGECLVTPQTEAADVGRLPYQQWERIHRSWSKTQQATQRIGGVELANEAFPVVERFRVPVRGMFILMLVFAVVIGPINLIVLSRKNRRIWLFWTVPLISGITCLAVSAYALFAEGFGAYVRTEGLTVLDEASRRATTIGMTAFYSPLTPGDGLRFGYETELAPQIESGTFYGRAQGNRTLDWTHDQHLARGWVTARVPAHFMVRKSEVRRERLAVREADDGSLSLVNGLGADIHELWLADEDGKIHFAENIRAGAETELLPYGAAHAQQAGGAASALREVFTSQWLSGVDRLAAKPERYLRPGCYIALLDGAPFIEQGLKKAHPRKCRSAVYGIMRRGTDES